MKWEVYKNSIKYSIKIKRIRKKWKFIIQKDTFEVEDIIMK